MASQWQPAIFLALKAESENLQRIEAIERHIDLAPEGEREEVRQIFLNKVSAART